MAPPRSNCGVSLFELYVCFNVFKACWPRDLYIENLSEILPLAIKAKTLLTGDKIIFGILLGRHTPMESQKCVSETLRPPGLLALIHPGRSVK